MSRGKKIMAGKHKQASLDLRFIRKRDMDSHLIAIKIGIEGGTHHGVNPDRLPPQRKADRGEAHAGIGQPVWRIIRVCCAVR